MDFRILGLITSVETIASGRGIRELKRLQRLYGKARWRKRRGEAMIELQDGAVQRAELHWYEASAVGRKEYKIKRYLD